MFHRREIKFHTFLVVLSNFVIFAPPAEPSSSDVHEFFCCQRNILQPITRENPHIIVPIYTIIVKIISKKQVR
jgi:hypothetical protein